jgi:hypothetical protein
MTYRIAAGPGPDALLPDAARPSTPWPRTGPRRRVPRFSQLVWTASPSDQESRKGRE